MTLSTLSHLGDVSSIWDVVPKNYQKPKHRNYSHVSVKLDRLDFGRREESLIIPPFSIPVIAH